MAKQGRQQCFIAFQVAWHGAQHFLTANRFLVDLKIFLRKREPKNDKSNFKVTKTKVN